MYCSLDEAFQTGNVIPEFRRKKRRGGNGGSNGGSGLGLIERFSAQTSEGLKPILPPPEAHVLEADRPTQKPPAVQYVGGGTATPTSYSNILSATDESSGSNFFLHPQPDAPGADMAYMLEPDWTAPFKSADAPPWIQNRIANKEAEVPLTLPEGNGYSSLFDGMPTLWQKVPAAEFAPSPHHPSTSTTEVSEDRLMLLESKLDGKLERMFAKLEAMEKGRSEANHMEVILFVLGGLFLVLMLDLLVKQGMRASMMLAAAGGGMLHKRYMT